MCFKTVFLTLEITKRRLIIKRKHQQETNISRILFLSQTNNILQGVIDEIPLYCCFNIFIIRVFWALTPVPSLVKTTILNFPHTTLTNMFYISLLSLPGLSFHLSFIYYLPAANSEQQISYFAPEIYSLYNQIMHTTLKI